MDSGVVAALVTSGASLAVALLSALSAGRDRKATRHLQRDQESTSRGLKLLEAQLQQQRDERDERRNARNELDRRRAAMLSSARDLRARIVNIEDEGFLSFLKSPDEARARIAFLSTTYRFARYWAVVEDLYGSVDELRFAEANETRPVATALTAVGKALASDRLGDTLMTWREEQRAVAELMWQADGAERLPRPIGFATFTRQYHERFENWFERWEEGLTEYDQCARDRLRQVRKALDELVAALDIGVRPPELNAEAVDGQTR